MGDTSTELPSWPSRTEAIAAHRQAGGRVGAVFPIHYPRPLLRAFGYLPVEVWGPPRIDTGPGDAHLQAYTCSIVRSGLAFLEQGGLDVTDLLVVPHGCDSLQGLGSVLLDFLPPSQPVVPFYIPRGAGPSGPEYMAAELRRVYDRLAEVTGQRPDDASILRYLRDDEEADALLGRLLEERPHLPLADRDFYRVVRSREYLPAERFAELAEEVLQLPRSGGPAGLPLILSGVVPEPMAVFDALSDGGGVVVGDDLLSSGRRVYPPGRSDEPFLRMAERLLDAPADSTRGDTTAGRIAHLRGLAERSGARAVVFYLVKFCEPELFYLPQIRAALEADGLRSVVIEVDLHDGLTHQVITRLEALLETAA